jgi:hypothetical protein
MHRGTANANDNELFKRANGVGTTKSLTYGYAVPGAYIFYLQGMNHFLSVKPFDLFRQVPFIHKPPSQFPGGGVKGRGISPARKAGLIHPFRIRPQRFK